MPPVAAGAGAGVGRRRAEDELSREMGVAASGQGTEACDAGSRRAMLPEVLSVTAQRKRQALRMDTAIDYAQGSLLTGADLVRSWGCRFVALKVSASQAAR